MKRVMMVVAMAVLLCAPSFAVEAWQPVTFKRSTNHIDVLVGGQPFTTYYFNPNIAKPYFMTLRSAEGTIITRGFPVGNTVPPAHQHDPNLEPHQRPMYFGHGNVDGIDFWGEALFPKWSDDSVFGRTVLVKIEEVKDGPTSGTLHALFHLVGPKGRIIADETQDFTIRGNKQDRMIDCDFTIIADHGSDVTMGDTKEGTFALRLTKALYVPPAQRVNSNGLVGKNVWGKRADWVDYYGKVGNEQVGVAIFDSPKSFRHPTYWHARGYGLFAANPFGIREFTGNPNKDGSWTIRQNQSLSFRYRVFIHHGDYKQAHVAEAYQTYASEQEK